MMSFSFTAPTLWEPDADADAILSASDVCYSASRESLERLAKIKRFVVWLKAEMEKAGLPTEKGCFSTENPGGGSSMLPPTKAS
jgi:hypothetical protein